MKQVTIVSLSLLLLIACYRDKPIPNASIILPHVEAGNIKYYNDSILPYCKAEEYLLGETDSVYAYYYYGQLVRVEDVMLIENYDMRRVIRFYFDGTHTLVTFPYKLYPDSADNSNPHFSILYNDTTMVYYKANNMRYSLPMNVHNARVVAHYKKRLLFHKQASYRLSKAS